MAEEQKVSGQQAATETVETSDFASLLNKEFKPRTDRAKEAISSAVETLAEYVLKDTAIVSDDAIASIQSLIAQIDQKLTEQVNKIMHNEEFQKLESAWRGLSYMVNNTETDESLKIKVMSISKKELHKTLKKYKGTAWDQSPLFKQMYEAEYGQFGGEPFGCMTGDYYFDHSPQDVEILKGMAQICAAMHAPFISAVAPKTLQFDSWAELSNPRDLTKIFGTPEYAAWRSLRESDDSRYLGLAMPRFLGRTPYGAKTDPVDEFDYEEDTEGADSSNYLCCNAAFAMATNINRSFNSFCNGMF